MIRALVPMLPLLLATLLTVGRAQDAEPERIGLWNGRAPVGGGQTEAAETWITVHRPAQPNGAAIVVCPGGGYGTLVVEPEGHGIARWLNRHGVTGVVLEYRLPAGRHEVPLLDAQQAIRTVRAHAKEWQIDPARVGIMGFSAGGHLASTAGTHFDDGKADAADAVQRYSSRPDFMILIYPAISMDQLAHRGSRTRLLGEEPTQELIDRFSNEKQVTAKTPPAFLAHAKDDKVVPIAHSEAFYKALQAHKVPAKLLELPSGGHGLNRYQGPMWDAWQEQSLQWLAELKFIPPPQRGASDQRRGSDTLVVAHRGLLLHAPENTLANFTACLELGLGFEFDARRTKDGHLVVLHDATVDRTTNGQGPLAAMTLDEVQRLDAGLWFHTRFAGQRVPTVDQVLVLVSAHRGKPLLVAVDIKGDDSLIERDLIKLAQKHDVLPRLLFIGRTIDAPEVRQRLRQASPAANVACLANRPEEFNSALNDPHANWVYLRYLPSPSEVQQVHQRGKRVFIAGPTVAGNLPDAWRQATAAGVDAVLTDYSLEFASQLRQAGRQAAH